MTEQVSVNPRTRQVYLDNLRIFLTILVILHHASLVYGGSGTWFGGTLVDPNIDAYSAGLFPVFKGLQNG